MGELRWPIGLRNDSLLGSDAPKGFCLITIDENRARLIDSDQDAIAVRAQRPTKPVRIASALP